MKRLKLLAAVAVLGIPLAACEEATPPPPVGSIVGTVSIEGTGIDGVSVNLSNGNSTTTAGGGSYRFDNVEGGAYTVTISGYPSDATFDATSSAATISSAGQSVTVNFSGAYIRTASVMGTVTVENMGLPGVTVTLTGVSGATATTDDSGQYAFTGLRMGTYSVEISGFDNDEIGFSNTAASVSIGVGESKIVSFDGTYLRTAAIMGRVSVEGEGLEGVTVSLAGGPDNTDMTTMTDAAGQYSFAKLRAGDYAVGISGYDTDDFEFEVTSQNVTVALGETANVPFEGVLLRTSGVSGRVSVEGIGLEGVMVTLSAMDMDDMTAMTDAGGLYAFAGLAAGDYTVAIALSDEQMAAYVFDMTSMDVTVGDDETQIVNFEAEHAATASIKVQLFVDEGTKNNMHDDGEMMFPSAEMIQMVAQMGLPLPLDQVVSLAGPGVHDMQQGMTMPDGSVMFSGLKAGAYQVLVTDLTADMLAQLPPTLAAVLQDYAYGGPATGYPVALGVGQEATQYAPIDITHTTLTFGVTLKGGDHRGEPVPGAAVTLYADADGETKVGEGMTNEMGGTRIRFARAGTSGNMVHAAVSVDDYFVDPTAGMQAVMWNAMSPVYPAPGATPPAVLNDANILNLAVDVMVGGATVTTDYGGGNPLAGWFIGVLQGTDPTALEMVEGDDVPAQLDEDGMASFMRMVTPADLPAVYHFGVAPDQPNVLDGGESYEGSSVMHTHTGLTLARTMDAGMIEVQYTTQTLKVYVHHERDQVHGYTGNVLGGDARVSGMLDVDIRYIADNGRSRAFASDDWRKTSSTFTDSRGVVTFRGVPADANVIVVADEAAQDPEDEDYQPIMLLDPDELAAYTDMEANGITGGAFGEMGGFHHTVELCPLMATDPTDQDHGECGSFAFVETYAVHGQAWKNDVIMNSSNDGFTTRGLRAVPGTTVDIDPVEGKNLAGESDSFTAASSDNTRTGIDETKQFNFGRMAAGVYKVTVPSGWTARVGTPDESVPLGTAFNPLAGDVQVDVTPTTGILYGRVIDAAGFPLDSTTVDVNGMSTETDEFGRYIVDGFGSRTGANRNSGDAWYRQRIVAITASRGGFDLKADTIPFGGTVNTPTEHEIDLATTAMTATVSGTVTAFGSDSPIAGVEIQVDGMAPINKNAKSVRTLTANDIYVTDSNGAYEISVPAKGVGQTSRISAHRAGMTFSPAHLDLSTPSGASISGINFQGVANSTIAGRVKDPDGGPFAGVKVTATAAGATAATDSATTGATGTFSLSVPAGTYDVNASKDDYTFTCPGDPASCRITVGLGQTGSFGDFTSTKDDPPPTPPSDDATLSALSLSDGTLDPAFSSADTMYTANVGVDTDSITVTATATHDSATVEFSSDDADTVAAGYQVGLVVGENNFMVTVTAEDGETTMRYHLTVMRSDGHEAPSAPTSFEVEPGDQSATLTWMAPRQIGSSAITGYDWEASAPGQLTRSGTHTAAAVNGVFTQAVADPNSLVNGATYTFKVWAVNTKGTPAVNVRGPAATATAKAQPSITMALSSTTLAEEPTGATDTATVTITLSNPSTEAITVTVGEKFAEGDEDMTSQVDITNPTIVIAAGSTTAAADADPTTITAKDDVVDDDAANALVQATATNAIDSDADLGTEGLQPAAITITDDDSVSGAPQNLDAAVGNAQLTVEWTSPADNGTSDITHYEYRYALTADIDDATWADVSGGANSRVVVIGNLTNDSEYTVQVRAVTAAGDGAAASTTGTPTG